jgi:hypothetical protein
MAALAPRSGRVMPIAGFYRTVPASRVLSYSGGGSTILTGGRSIMSEIDSGTRMLANVVTVVLVLALAVSFFVVIRAGLDAAGH